MNMKRSGVQIVDSPITSNSDFFKRYPYFGNNRKLLNMLFLKKEIFENDQLK